MARGRLVYVMGPSGAGKDSVIRCARDAIAGRMPVVFAHRYITRPAGEDIENYIALSRAEFALRKRYGLFHFDWSAYGLHYAIGVEIRRWLDSGLSVVVDGSRAHFMANRARLRGVLPVLITAREDELRRRLEARGREDAREIERRLARARRFAPRHHRLSAIDNSGALEIAGRRFVSLLKQLK